MGDPSSPEPVLALRDAFATAPAYDHETRKQLGGVYRADGTLVERALRSPRGVAWKHADQATLSADARTAPQQHVERAAYGGRYYAHFGHFLLESVPALYQAEPLAELIACHPNPGGWHPDWVDARFRGFLLAALGLSRDRIHLIEQPTQFDQLLVPALEQPPVMGAVGSAFVEACAQIREYALSEAPAAKGRVYLSRRFFEGGSNRVVDNEEAMEAVFAAHGFTIVAPEQLPIGDQIRLVAEADFVAGIDGSALHLCAFMRAGAKVLILETRPFRTQRAINAALGVTTLSLPAPFVRREEAIDVYTTDLDGLSRLLDKEAP